MKVKRVKHDVCAASPESASAMASYDKDPFYLR